MAVRVNQAWQSELARKDHLFTITH